MIPQKIIRLRGAAGCFLLCGCSLLQDPDSLTGGRRNDGGSGGALDAGAGGAGAGGAPTSVTCAPGGSDSSCDGLDEACQPTLSDAACPAGCTGTAFEGASYMGCTVSADFNSADVLCQRQGMHLVEVDSASENARVTQIAQTLGSYVWVGGSDLKLSGTFAWLDGPAFYADGAPVLDVYQNFDAGQPAKTAGLDCIQLHDDPSGPWSNARCGDSKQFICERR